MQRLKHLLLLTVVISQFSSGDADRIFIPIVDEKIHDCGHTGYIDWSEFELLAYNDTHTFMNGKIKMLKEIHSPWSIKVSSERFDRGEWHTGEIQRSIPDMCLELQEEVEPWYPVSKRMLQKSCPYFPGYVEHINMWPVSGFKIFIPPSFQGKWRVSKALDSI